MPGNLDDNKPEDNNEDKPTQIPEWLKVDIFGNILQENIENYAEVLNFNVKPVVGTGENFMTVLLNVLLNISLKDGTTKQESFVVKIMPNNERMQKFLKDWKVFDKELNTYMNYIPEFEAMYQKAGKNVKFGPKVYTSKSTSAPKELVVMEDLRTEGFTNIKRQDGLDMNHTKNALERLAEFHAASACRFESNGPYPKIYNQCLCSTEDHFVEHRLNAAKLLIKCLPLYNASHLATKLKEYTAVVPDQFQVKSQLYPGEFNVLNHGDCWSNNILFRYDANGSIVDTLFVDFQMSRYGSPAHDLNYLLISSTKLENKLKYFDYYISYYHDKLTENLRLLNYKKKFPTLKDLHMSLFRHGDWGYTIVTTVMPVLLLDPTEKANIDNIIDDGDESDELKKIMFTSNRYIMHMEKLLPWLDNRGLLSYST